MGAVKELAYPEIIVYTFKLCQVGLLVVLAIMAMTIFFRTEMHRDLLNFPWWFQGFLFSTSKRDCLSFPSWVYALPPWNPKNSHDQDKRRRFGVFLTDDVIGFEPYV